MLFKKLYNWIKYKTLPPSVLFKNRLFIERDSKTRRIFNNFGLTFRNSKWSSYSSYNINPSFKSKYFFFLLFIGIFIFSFKFFSLKLFFYNFFFFIWLTIDSFDYYLSFFLWILSAALTLFTNSLTSLLVNGDYKSSHSFKSTEKLYQNSTLNSNNLSKQDLNWILYSWLSNNDTDDYEESYEFLFDSEIVTKFWNENFKFYIDLYRSVFFLNLDSKNFNFFFFKKNFYNLNYNLNYRDLFLSIEKITTKNNLFSIILNYYFNMQNINSSLNFHLSKHFKNSTLNSRFAWNLESFENININDFSKNGIFYLNNLNFQNISTFLKNNDISFLFKNTFNDVSNVSKWDRWLYKYSLIHRKSVKTLNKLVNVKRSLRFDIIDKSFINKNIWISNYLKQNKNLLFLFNNFHSQPLFSLNNSFLINNTSNKINTLKLFNFQDISYSWLIKRFYFFNSMNSNIYNLKTKNFNFMLNNKQLTNATLTQKKLFLNYCNFYLLKNKESLLTDISFTSSNTDLKEFLFSNKNNLIFLNTKDSFIVNDDFDFFSKDLIQNLIYLTSNSSNVVNTNIFLVTRLSQKKIIFKPKSLKNTANTRFKKTLIRSLFNYDKFATVDFLTSTNFK